MSAQEFVLPAGRQALEYLLDHLDPERKWRVSVSLYKKRRTQAQNAYLWGVAYKTLEQCTGQPADDWHEYFLGEHFGWDEVELFGKRKLRPKRSSAALSTVEFSEYVEFIQRRADEHGVYIPDPGIDP